MSNIVKLSDATDAQLRQFATEVLGLPVPNAERGAALRARIASVYDKDEIALPEAPQPAQGRRPTASAADPAAGEEEPMLTIIINKTEEAGGADPVWVSVNGRGMWIPRGERCKVKKRYVDVLVNAVRTAYEQPEGPKGPMIAREVPAYPYSILPA